MKDKLTALVLACTLANPGAGFIGAAKAAEEPADKEKADKPFEQQLIGYWAPDWDEISVKWKPMFEELAKLGVSDPEDVKDAVVVRTLKAYPAYFGSYDRFDEVRDYMNRFENLFLVGRNGMHRYNNQDHSMLTAMVAVDGILEGRDTHAELWEINTEQEYHEAKKD